MNPTENNLSKDKVSENFVYFFVRVLGKRIYFPSKYPEDYNTKRIIRNVLASKKDFDT